MVFLRTKKVKGKEYGFLVANEWQKKGSRQKVRGYLGRIYRFNVKNTLSFSEFLNAENLESYIANKNKNDIIKDLIEWELFKFGIDKREYGIDLNNKKIQKGKRNIVMLLNDGFLCNITLKNLLEFKPGGDEETDGYILAKAFVDAGIKIPQDVFVGIFSNLYKTTA